MKKHNFNVPLYDYDVTLIQVESNEDKSSVISFLKKAKLDEYIEGCSKYVADGYTNGGETYYNRSIKQVICIFYIMTSDEYRENVYSHEKRHVEDRILEHCSVNDMEASAYLAGFLGVQFYKFKKLQNK